VLGFAVGHYRGWLSEFKRNEKEAENENWTLGKYRAGFRNLLRVGFASSLYFSNELFL
jgi:hypothetical protein